MRLRAGTSAEVQTPSHNGAAEYAGAQTGLTTPRSQTRLLPPVEVEPRDFCCFGVSWLPSVPTFRPQACARFWQGGGGFVSVGLHSGGVPPLLWHHPPVSSVIWIVGGQKIDAFAAA